MENLHKGEVSTSLISVSEKKRECRKTHTSFQGKWGQDKK